MKLNLFIISLLGSLLVISCPLVSLAVSPASPDQKEPPQFVPKPLLELFNQRKEIDTKIRDIWAEIEPEGETLSPPAKNGPGPLDILDWRREQVKKLGAHGKVRELQNLQKKRTNIAAKAWETYRNHIAEQKESTTDVSKTKNNDELRKWMRESFGRPTPQGQPNSAQNGNLQLPERAAQLRNQLDRSAKRIQNLENRVQDLEKTIVDQGREISELKNRLKAIESKTR
jgi:chromosome segregation ATPase